MARATQYLLLVVTKSGNSNVTYILTEEIFLAEVRGFLQRLNLLTLVGIVNVWGNTIESRGVEYRDIVTALP